MESSLRTNSNPLFEIKLELTEDKIQFSPTLDEQDEDNFQKLLQNLIDDIYRMGHHIPRVSEGGLAILDFIIIDNFNKLLGIEAMSDLIGLVYLVDFIKNLLDEAVEECRNFALGYEQYEYLWVDDKQEKLQEILADFEEKKNAFLMLERFKMEVINIIFLFLTLFTNWEK